MNNCDTLITNATIIDGSGDETAVRAGDVAIVGGRIAAVDSRLDWRAASVVDAGGFALSPGFIDVHTHDDIYVINRPQAWPKLSQGVTTLVVGNCGISAAPAVLGGGGKIVPDPMNLLGRSEDFRYPDFGSYVAAINEARPAVNVAALVGHTTLRNNHLDRLDRPATDAEIAAMRDQLRDALAQGALGLSTGLAYANAFAATAEEVIRLAEPLGESGALYVTHLRNEFADIRPAMDEAFRIGKESRAPIFISHLKCAGVENWGRGAEVLTALDQARGGQSAGADCYPYAAASSTLDLKQVTDQIDIAITWSEPHPAACGKMLAEIAGAWGLDLMETARRLQPAGAIYYSMSEQDVRRILEHPATVVGSDGLPNDPLPHPRLWGTFPRVLGHYCREQNLFSLPAAIHKMTGLSARRYKLAERGLIKEGFWADLVLFDPATVRDTATFSDPAQPAAGIEAVWVNGVLSSRGQQPIGGQRAGRFLARQAVEV